MLGGNNGDPTVDFVVTYITVTTAGVATGTLPPATIDGFKKEIYLTSAVPGATYELSCPAGRLIDPGSGTSGSKILRFEVPGQSVVLRWDNVQNTYFIVNGGVCVI